MELFFLKKLIFAFFRLFFPEIQKDGLWPLDEHCKNVIKV
jgi:hypothetical protein